MQPRSIRALVALTALAAPLAAAQEAINTESATQPGPGTLYVKPQFRLWRYAPAPADSAAASSQGLTKTEISTTLQYGLVRDWSLSLKVPMLIEDAATQTADGRQRRTAVALGRIEPMAKWRFFREDSGPLDTFRAVLYAGALLPSGDDSLAPQSVDPFIGISAMLLRGRFGITQSFRYTLTTSGDEWNARNLGGDGPADSLRFDTAAMWRLAPSQFSPDNQSDALYASLELNGLYETNGDTEVLLAPGLLYEATRFAAEFSVGIPIARDVSNRPRLQYQISAGLRFLF